MTLKIIQKEHKALRQVAKEVPLKDIASPKIKKIVSDMKAVLTTQDDGVAIAAPQIEELVRIFVVSGKIFDPDFKRGQGLEHKKKTKIPDLVFINPKITRLSKEKSWVPEGCLSIRPWWGEVRRAEKATISAYDETGKKFTRGGSGLLSQIFQHETDHLEGILFTDKSRNLKKEENLRT